MIFIKLKRSFFLLLLLTFTIHFAQNKNQAKKDELENKKKKLQQEIQNINKELNETQKDKKSSMKKLVELNKKILMRQELITTINEQLSLTEIEINKKVNDINILNNDVKTQKELYSKLLVLQYKKNKSLNTISYFFSPQYHNQLARNLKYSEYINTKRKQIVANIKGKKEELNTKVIELEEIKNNQNSLLTSKEKEKQEFNVEKKEKEKTLTQLQHKEKDLKQLIKKKQEDAAKLNNAIKRIIEEEVKKAREAEIAKAKIKIKKAESNLKNSVSKNSNTNKEQKELKQAEIELEKAESSKSNSEVFSLSPETQKLSSLFENNKNSLPWPVISGQISSTYGEHPHPELKGIKIKNNGLDFVTKPGNFRAVFDGEVSGVIQIPGAGKAIIVRHGQYLTVYSNADEVQVKKGDKIKTKQTIGTIALNDDGKPELHFEIWKGSQTLNPQLWLK
jgi:murein hydrolase activator